MKYISFIAALALLVTGTQSCIVRIDKTKALEMVRLFNNYTIKASGNKMTKKSRLETVIALLQVTALMWSTSRMGRTS